MEKIEEPEVQLSEEIVVAIKQLRKDKFDLMVSLFVKIDETNTGALSQAEVLRALEALEVKKSEEDFKVFLGANALGDKEKLAFPEYIGVVLSLVTGQPSTAQAEALIGEIRRKSGMELTPENIASLVENGLSIIAEQEMDLGIAVEDEGHVHQVKRFGVEPMQKQ